MKPKRFKKAGATHEETSKPTAVETGPKLTDGDDVPVAAIGASAGGLEAFRDLLSHLPVDTGMAFVLVQHLDPKHESMLTELISRSTKMPVLEVKNGMGVEANHVYVIPPNATMTIDDHTLRLGTREETRGQHMAVDSFMRALAEAQGSNAIGVILSGSGTDGTLGLAEIQAQGGVTFAQDEATARHDGMPRSAIASGCVDFVLPPARIARELTRLARHPYVARRPKEEAADLIPEQRDGLNTIFQLLRKSTGADFTHYRRTTIRRRIQRRMIVHKIDTLPRYVKYMQQNPGELKALYQDMLINVTSFFRNPSVFEAIKARIFPAIFKNRSGDVPIRIWVPGCSSGEEPYSLAIALLEFLGNKASSVPIKFFGSDLSETGINKARNGVYPENIQGDVSPERLRRFFAKVEGGYRINQSVRDMCIFAQHNLLVDPPFSQMDIVSCRNVLIYLEGPLQKNVVSVFHYALNPHGFLVLGTAESVGVMTNLFSLEDRASRIYTKRETAIRPVLAFSTGRQLVPAPRGTGLQAVARHETSWNIAEAQKEFDRRLLKQFAPAAVLVDETLEMVHLRGNVDRYLKLSSGRATLGLLKIAREGLQLELSNAIARAKKENATVRREHIEVKTDHAVRDVSFQVIPLRVANTREPCLMIVFEETREERKQHTGRRGVVPLRKETSSKRMIKLRQELASTTEYLHTLIENQEATNAELQSANEEILSSNEELQSTNEELETAKEELQSTNEELSTVNDELRSRNREIVQANSDLNNLLASINVAVIILGNDLRIRRFTQEAQKMLGLTSNDVGNPLGNIVGSSIPDLSQLVLQVTRDFIPVEQNVQMRSGKQYTLRILPYRTFDNKVDGAVITFVAESKREARLAGEAILAGHPSYPIAVLDSELRVKAATPSFQGLFQLSPETIQNLPLHRVSEVFFGNPELQKALQKARQSNEAIAPLTVELKIDGDSSRRFECRLERIALDGGAKVITLSLHTPPTAQKSVETKA